MSLHAHSIASLSEAVEPSTHRGYTQVPTMDVQRHVQAQAQTFGWGFVVGVGVGAVVGKTVFELLRNARGSR
jgi:hypothetical protein